MGLYYQKSRFILTLNVRSNTIDGSKIDDHRNEAEK